MTAGSSPAPFVPDDISAAVRAAAGTETESNPAAVTGGTPAELRDADYSLVQSGALTEQQLTGLYSEKTGIRIPDESDLEEPLPFPEGGFDFFQANFCVPYEWDDESLVFLVSDPYSVGSLTYAARKQWKRKAGFLLARRTCVERFLSRLRGMGEEESGDAAGPDTDDENTLRNMAGEARIVRLVNDIFTRAIEAGASDIHVEPGMEQVSVRCRIDGVLHEIMTCPLNQFPAISSRIKLLGGLNIAESRVPQDGRTSIRLGRDTLDMRISTIPILTGESLVLRLLNQEALTFDLTSLGMTDSLLDKFRTLIRLPHGMILVVGPTGSGKTTTLYSVMHLLNDRTRKIITVEDPVEYKMRGLCQMQVNSKIGVTFASGLRSIVRQDPDIILVGEIRDRETADIAVNAALTGHLVLSTLHTNDAAGAVTRLLDMGIEPFLVSSALSGVLSQRLVRKICPVCRGVPAQTASCRACSRTGFKGRSGIFELLLVNDEFRSAVNRSADSSELQAIAVRNGMTTLRQDAEEKVRLGVTTADEALRSVAADSD